MPNYCLPLFKLGRRTRKAIRLDAPCDEDAIRDVQRHIHGPAMLLCQGGRRVARFPASSDPARRPQVLLDAERA
jgi:hypothetical protein